MIYPLRRRHRNMIIVLSLLVPLLLFISLLGRPAPAEVNSEIPTSQEFMDEGYAAIPNASGEFSTQPILKYRLLSGMADNKRAIELFASEQLRMPELLVYWSTVSEENIESLPENSFLLGAWAVTTTQVHKLPEVAQEASGSIILYSLSQQYVVTSTLLN